MTTTSSSIRAAESQQALLNTALIIVASATMIGAMAGYGIATFALARSRRADFSLQLACGASATGLFVQSVVESGFIGFLGGLTGLAIAAAFIPLSGPVTGLDASIAIADLVWPPVLGLLVGCLGGAAGAMRAARIDPAESLRLA